MPNIASTKAIFRQVIKLQHEKGIKIPIMLHGDTGVGKTALVEQIGKEYGYDVVIKNLSTETPEDLIGQINGQGGHFKPKWILETDKPVIYFLDEFNRGPKYVIQAMFNFINGGIVASHKIKPTDIVIAACNPDNENYVVTTFDDHALIARFCHLKVVPDKDEYVAYLNKTNISNPIIQTLVLNTENVFSAKPFDLSFTIKPSNRWLEVIAKCLDNIEEIDVLWLEMFQGMVGSETAELIRKQFIEFNDTKYTAKNFYKHGHSFIDLSQIDGIHTLINDIGAFNAKNEISDEMYMKLYHLFMFLPREYSKVVIQKAINVKGGEKGFTEFLDVLRKNDLEDKFQSYLVELLKNEDMTYDANKAKVS